MIKLAIDLGSSLTKIYRADANNGIALFVRFGKTGRRGRRPLPCRLGKIRLERFYVKGVAAKVRRETSPRPTVVIGFYR